MKDKLINALEQVEDEESFISFVAALAEDKSEESREELSNPSSPLAAALKAGKIQELRIFLMQLRHGRRLHKMALSIIKNHKTFGEDVQTSCMPGRYMNNLL